MAEEKLIEAVREHRELYDTKHADYMKVKLKNRIWSDIAKDLNLKDGEETKSSWLKLRGSYRDARRRRRRRRQVKCMKSGAAAESIKPRRYQNQMSFLEPFMTAGPRDSNLGDDSDHSSQATTKTSARSDTLETEELEDNNSLDNEECISTDSDQQTASHYSEQQQMEDLKVDTTEPGKNNCVGDALSRIKEVKAANTEPGANESEEVTVVEEDEQQEITAEEKAEIP
ncbi:uncharacterized protein LOC126252273 [Schistocerca nitens]|uniref:uncharacterized protein LOC126252273 n=1 Tax=Schistocerca nitens TaxID=7011 RepID=UPI002117EC66|nr:uncharacterized protein LOC126252273 [Schistocerca nitens]